MNLSDDRQDYLASIIVDGLLKDKKISASSRDVVFQKVKIGFNQFMREYNQLDQEITEKLKSIKRGVLPGSSEWDVLYGQFFEEEFRKKSSLFIKT